MNLNKKTVFNHEICQIYKKLQKIMLINITLLSYLLYFLNKNLSVRDIVKISLQPQPSPLPSPLFFSPEATILKKKFV